MSSFTIIIPARLASSRFPGKVLAMLEGKPVLQHVWEAAVAIAGHDNVWIAVDCDHLDRAARAFGASSVITPEKCPCGTVRVAMAAEAIGIEPDVVVNLQADEPLITPLHIGKLLDCFTDPAVQIATLCQRFDSHLGYDALADTSLVKVARDCDDNAIFFSRSVIPYVDADRRDSLRLSSTAHYTHMGIYAFRSRTLRQISALEPSPDARAESLEQLTWLNHGYKIKCPIVQGMPTIGIDTPSDLQRASQLLAK